MLTRYRSGAPASWKTMGAALPRAPTQWRSQGGASRGQAPVVETRPRLSKLGPVVETRVGPLPQYFNIGAPLNSCNGGSTPMMECIVQAYFVSNGYLNITALLLFDNYFVISQYMYSDIFSSFFVNF